MINIVSDKNVKNGEVIYKHEAEGLLQNDSVKIYEVIRVINKKPVFLNEHFDRMNNSIALSGINESINYEDYKNNVELIIKENNFENMNIRVSYIKENEKHVVLMYFIKSSYPTKEEFENGIITVTVKKHRKNPNIKHYEADFKESIDKLLKEKNAFEAILVNEDNTISEGSKSNVFFVKGSELITSKDSDVLLGVTRSKVIDVSEKNNTKVVKREIFVEELANFDGAFITGTSNDVLPIRKIDEIVYDSSQNETIKKVSQLYLSEMLKD